VEFVFSTLRLAGYSISNLQKFNLLSGPWAKPLRKSESVFGKNKGFSPLYK